MIPSRTDGGPDIQLPSIINLPSIIDGEWNINWPSFTIPNIPPFPPISFTVPPANINFPPIIFGQPHYDCTPPSFISLIMPDVSKISVTWSEPPNISCVCLIRDPGCTDTEYLLAKEKHGVQVTTEEKCKAILEKIVEIANEDKPIGFEGDLGGWTLTVTKGKMHTHVGIPGKDGNFDVLVNNLYDLLIKGKGLSWAQ